MKKKIVIKNVAIILLLVSIIAVAITRFNNGKDYIDNLVNQYNPQGAAVVIIKNGVISEVRNYGYANVEKKVAITDETQFKIASISKTITAYAVMKLVDEGKLDLDTPINTYLTKWKLPHTKFDENKVTIRTLMSHTSGIKGSDECGYKEPLPTIDEALKSRDVKLKREPGKIFEYSEFAGFGICQLIIEEAVSSKFEEYMESNIFKPLGMEHTSYKNWNSNGKFATPYAGKSKPIGITPIVMNGGGGVSTTATDLARFVVKLMDYYNNGNREMFKPQKNTQSVGGLYALGIIPRELKNGKIVYEHNGTLTGWNAQMAFEPVSKNGMVILTNSDKSYYMTYDLMEKWGERVIGEKVIDTQMKQISKMVFNIIVTLSMILLLLVAVLVIKIKRESVILSEKRKTRYITSAIIVFALAALYYAFIYTELPFKLLFNMQNYYLFTFFPLNFRWVNIILVFIGIFIVFRSRYSKNKF
ncbi:beta-lactamase family protein [Clostridium estertheticum]|uniref:serine hydrolase domain-containing protein n=1 Tax=Clostridium estertheticum TaxID=238834 RepID=UPI00209AEAF6|nr:serine hydrolase domain-containing protein [Clostridium estertheticum]WAG53706.1 beta-lactamase family protein [Clostridium estertheticum]